MLITLFALTKRQMMSWTHRDLLFGSKSRCFTCKNHRWGLGPIETCYSLYFCTKRRCFAIKNLKWGRGPIETSKSDAKHAVVHAQSDRSCLGTIGTCYSGPEVAVLHGKTTGGVWDPQRLVILVLKSLFICTKSQVRAGTYIVLILWCEARYYVHSKPQMRSGTHRDK